MISMTGTSKVQIFIVIVIAFIYIYRSEFRTQRFQEDIPEEVRDCIDSKLQALLSSPKSDYQIVDLALNECSKEVKGWLAGYTANEDEFGMTYSYLRDYYISEIKYSRQPATGG